MLTVLFALYAVPAWSNTAANTQIINNARASYNDGTGTKYTLYSQVTVTVALVPSAPAIVKGPDQNTGYTGTDTQLNNSFTVTATANGLDTYTLSGSITDQTNNGNSGSLGTISPASPVTLGATVVLGIDGTKKIITVPSDGVADSSINGITSSSTVAIGASQEVHTIVSIVDNATGTSTITLNSAMVAAVNAGDLVAEQKTVTVLVKSGTIQASGLSIVITKTLTVASTSGSRPSNTSGTITDTYTKGQVSFVKYVRNVTTSAAGTGTAYSYNSINYYPAGVTAKPGDILEYILVARNTGTVGVSAAVVTDVLPVSYVTLKTGVYGGSGRDFKYVPNSAFPAMYSTFSAAAGDDAAVYNVATLTVNVGGTNPPIPPAAGGTIAAGRTVLVLYEVTVNNLVQGDKIINSAQISSPDITPAISSVTVTATNNFMAAFSKYVRNVTTSIAGTGTPYVYGGKNYYLAGVTAKPGDILEYIMVTKNTGTGDVSASVVKDVLPVTYVSLKTGAYSGATDITYVNEAGTASYLTAAGDTDAGSWASPTLTVNVGTGATSSAGGTIAAGKTVLVLYEVTVDNLGQADKIINSAQISSPDITPATSSVTATATKSGAVTFSKYVRNITTSGAGTGTPYVYGGKNYYLAGITAKQGDILEYIMVTKNNGTGDVSASVVTDVLPTSYVSLKTGVYSGATDMTYVDEAGVVSYLTAAGDTDAGSWASPTLTVNVGTGATNSAGGTIAAGKTVLVLYEVTVNNLGQADKIINSAQISSPDITPVKSSVTVTAAAISGVASTAKYVRNVTVPGGSGTPYAYGGNNYYLVGVTVKPGDILEYILIAKNTGTVDISASVVTDVLPTSYVSLKTGVYSGATDITYVNDAGTASYLTAAADTDAAIYAAPTLTVNVGTGATNIAGGTIPAGKSVFVLYQVNVNNPVQGDKIINSVRFYSPDIILPAPTSAVTVTAVIRTKSVIEFLTYAPLLSGSDQVNVSTTAYRKCGATTDSFVNMPAPIPVGTTTPIDLSHPVPLTASTQLHQGELIFIRLTDLDQNLDKTVAETVLVTISNPANGDSEVIRLTETGPNTGVFAGYLPTISITSGPATSCNGIMSVNAGDKLTDSYVDIMDPSDTSVTNEMVDPYGIVLDSSTGLPVDGATITIINTDTGQPAVVFGDDGVSTFPATITSGGSATDSSGRVYSFPQGGYRFSFVLPGNYQYKVTPPPGYGFPSSVADATIQALPGNPFTIVSGSRGEIFVINPGPSIRIDIPLDPGSSALWLQKSVAKDFAGYGDFIPYLLTITNNSKLIAAYGVVVADAMPIGFRLRKGSVKINSVPAGDPTISADGRTLTFNIGNMAGGSNTKINYVAEVTAGTRLGEAINTAIATANNGEKSNKAHATVTIRDDLMRTSSTLMGRVSTGACNDKTGEGTEGLEGVRVYLEDGTFVISDKRGMFHFEGVRAGLHVVQLDMDSLPEGYEPFACTQNSRFAGRSFSQFVETQGGALWRADFHVRSKVKASEKAPTRKGEIVLELANVLEKENIAYKVAVKGNTLPVVAARLNIILPEGVVYKKGSAKMDGAEIADPSEKEKTWLVFRLNDLPAGQRREITFRATPSGDAKTGTLATQAYLTAEGEAKAEIVTPPAETIIKVEKNEKISQMPDIVLRPHFPVRGAQLNAEDRGKLDELAQSLASVRVEKIQVTGYTDNMPIAPRNRVEFADNQALSLARARSVGRYLMDKLKIPPEKMIIEGKGSENPVADNRTNEGRALNRRVEIHITSSSFSDSATWSVVKEQSGEKRVETNAVKDVPPGKNSTATPTVSASDNRKEGKTESSSAVTAMGTPDSAVQSTAAVSAEEKSEDTITDPEGILFPADKDTLASSVSSVRICLNSKLTPRLLVDHKEVPAKRIGFTMKDEKTGKAIYSYIGVDFGKTGNHVVVLEGIDPFGNSRFKKTISVKRSGEIASIRLKSGQGNVADGKKPVKLQLELYDADGVLIRAGAQLEILEGTLTPLKRPDIFAATPSAGSHPVVQMGGDGEVQFQPVSQSGLYRLVLGYNKVTAEVETYVQPKMRDWILVGVAEGTAGYNTLSGHMENVKSEGVDENFYHDGRVAFFAKGQIKGKWLLTMAYDSAKTKENSGNGLFQTINPETYFTLYGDSSQQQYDAASTNKLYVKIEREQFYAMFGDYDTGMTVTELSRYSRRMTGVKTELQGKHYEVNAFASRTDQIYTRDEIPGDGTSGMYHLSHRKIVSASEKITIVVRDRFQSEVVISSRTLSRFTDYSIDYDSGTVIFKEPVYSRDEKFNPIMIVAEYEIISEGGEDYTYGGRAGVKLLDNKLKAGGSYIHEGQGDRSSNLYGADVSVKLDDKTKLRAEYAKSKYDAGADSRSGSAYLAEVARTTKQYDAKTYFREQDTGFGLGQQPGSEAGTRKYGVEGKYRFNDKINASANIYRQYNLLTDATRDMAEGKFGYAEKNYGATIGFLHANDSQSISNSGGESNQITLGGKVLTLYDRLTLGINHAQSVGSNDNTDFPTRTTLSAELAVTKNLTLLAAQEFTWGSGGDTQNTRIGMRSSPWKGAEFNSSVARQFNENDDRVFANVGLKQNWEINKEWKVNAGMERSQTVSDAQHYRFNDNVQPASGNVTSTSGISEDFTAVSVGASYQVKKLTWDNRVEFRMAQTEDKWGLMSGVVKEVGDDWAWSGRIQYFQTSAKSIDTTKADLRYGLVYRPPQTKWIVLNRLDFIIDKQSGGVGTSYDTWRLVNNLMVNYRPQKELQLSLHYGAKYVQETIDIIDYRGYTDLIGAEGRYDINKDWDIGLQGSILHSWNASDFYYSSGLSVGYNVTQNAWLSLGYNLLGFEDKDFSQANFTGQGPYVRFRFKFDQNSVGDAAKWLGSH